MNFFGYSVRTTRLSKAWKSILDRNDRSLREWGEVVKACDVLNVQVLCSEHTHTRHTSGNDEDCLPEVYSGMQQCSWCGALSATLKKCKGCGVTR